MKALVTGFDPFGGDALNASWEAVRRLPSRIGSMQVITAQLPTSFKRAPLKLRTLIRREQPHIVLCVGLAADRGAISVERIAVNLDDARIADNDGALPANRPVIARAPVAYFSSLPVQKILDRLTVAGIAAEASLSAGTFVCNHVFFSLMHQAARGLRIRRAGFIHVPALPVDARKFDAARAMLTEGLSIALQTTQRDLGSARKKSPRA